MPLISEPGEAYRPGAARGPAFRLPCITSGGAEPALRESIVAGTCQAKGLWLPARSQRTKLRPRGLQLATRSSPKIPPMQAFRLDVQPKASVSLAAASERGEPAYKTARMTTPLHRPWPSSVERLPDRRNQNATRNNDCRDRHCSCTQMGQCRTVDGVVSRKIR